jgi:peptidoglycan/LPS O-acetylase OafA/YrhL
MVETDNRVQCILYCSLLSTARSLGLTRTAQAVSEAWQRFGFDALLAAAFVVFIMAMASLMLSALDSLKGAVGEVVSPASRKLASLEGLRGVLALSVVAHHAYCWYFFTQFGVWTTGRSVIFDRLADFGVMQFFYLSGFLFWRKLMKTRRIQVGRFYLSRFVRIAPVYYVCVGAAILTGLAAGGFRLSVAPADLMASLLPWILFSPGTPPMVNHADIARITSGVTWTLGLEWLFYLSLPFLGWFARKSWRLLVYALVFGAVFLVGRFLRSGTEMSGVQVTGAVLAVYAKFMLIGFGGGVLIAAMEPQLRELLRPILRWSNWLVPVFYIVYLTIPGIAAAGQILLLAAFALVVLGADVFGLLTNRAVRLLGVTSYPIYLIHGIVYFWAMRLRGGIHEMSVSAYIAETVLCLLVILVLATVLHLLVERPTMRASERIARAAAVPQEIAV